MNDEQRACTHGVTFDEEEAKRIMSNAPMVTSAVDFIMGPVDQTSEIRKRWPRGWFTPEKPCKCGFVGIAYASSAHYAYGDW